MPKVNITIETGSIEEGRQMLLGLEALMRLGSLPPTVTIGRTGDAVADAALEKADAALAGASTPAAEEGKKTRAPRSTKPAAAPAEEKPADPPPPAEPPAGTAAADAPAPKDDGQDEPEVKLSVDHLRQRVTYLSGIVGVPAAMAVVKLSGHDKIASIPEDKWATFSQLLEGKIAEAEAAKA